MKTNDILELDCRDNKNKQKIQKVLKLIKPFSKYSDEEFIELKYIEKAIYNIIKRYKVDICSIITDCESNDESIIYKIVIQYLGIYKVIYGLGIYELYAKTLIFMYSLIKSDKVDRR